MDADDPPRFVLEDLTVGVHACGFGRTDDGETFAFRVRGHLLHLEVYRRGYESEVPEQADVVATAECEITDVDLTDERSMTAVVRDAVARAEPVDPDRDGLTLRALLTRIGAAIPTGRPSPDARAPRPDGRTPD
ncbi:hypothetical protein [Rhodococcus kronopolitis]|uniref:Uncharacterized protein n=1 Tax=Rhodococcus kronopolitis TaxID=1460226 RepID=A0ABV9FVL0_9NOCA